MSHTPSQPDTGYTTGFYDGVKATEERIIKLLEDSILGCECEEIFCADKADDFIVERCITLIKGETNG